MYVCMYNTTPANLTFFPCVVSLKKKIFSLTFFDSDNNHCGKNKNGINFHIDGVLEVFAKFEYTWMIDILILMMHTNIQYLVDRIYMHDQL